MPIVLLLLEAGRVDWRREDNVGPTDEVRFDVEDFRRFEMAGSSGWL